MAVTAPLVIEESAASARQEGLRSPRRYRLTEVRSLSTPRASIAAAKRSSSKPWRLIQSASVMGGNVRITHIHVKRACESTHMANVEIWSHHGSMPRRKKAETPVWTLTFLREWRLHAKRTLEQMAPLMGITHSQLSKIERGIYQYKQKILEVAAREYGCTVGDILTRRPSEGDEVIEIVRHFDEDERSQAVRLLKAIRKP